MSRLRNINSKQFVRAAQLLEGRLRHTPILKHPAFAYKFNLTGYKNFTFGGRAGPSIDIENIMHEMAHAIEFVLAGEKAKDRCRINGSFDFHIPQIEINGRLYTECFTTKITERELRTFVIQHKLMNLLGFKRKLEPWYWESAQLVTYLPDFFNISPCPEDQVPTDEMRKTWSVGRMKEMDQQINEADLIPALLKWLDEVQEMQTLEAG